MAKATRDIEEVEKVVTTTEKVETFTLVLTREEARSLVALTGCIGGDSEPRRNASNVYVALVSAGLPGVRFIKRDGSALFIEGGGATLKDLSF